jgi:type II secretory pathway pseudopilin PulG
MIKPKSKKAASLIEIIIVLAIVSFTIIASISLVARTRIEIRNNEIEDKANEVLLKALEALKAPTRVVILNDETLPQTSECRSGTGSCFSGSGPYYFSLENVGSSQAGTNVYVLRYQPTGTFDNWPEPGSDFDFTEVCSTGSGNPFYIIDESEFSYCQQVAITPIRSVRVTSEAYKVDTTIIYSIGGESKLTTLTTYRYGGFQLQTQ